MENIFHKLVSLTLLVNILNNNMTLMNMELDIIIKDLIIKRQFKIIEDNKLS